jgi:ATP-binding cassette subfamily F protein uup
MSTLLGTQNLSKAHGSKVLFQDLCFPVCKGDRIGLIGPNGAGKSTLMKILADIEHADSGKITKRSGLVISYAGQFPTFEDKSLIETLTEGLPGDTHQLEIKAQILLGKALFTDFSQRANILSGGWKKRLDLVRSLMLDPDVLLLDEPTNHLDLEGILWLENFLKRQDLTYVVISHDRYFLEQVTNKVIELNPCYPEGMFSSEGNMSKFIEHKEAFLQGQQQRQKGLSTVVRNETEWLRTGPKARTTKSRSRIEKAYNLQDELSDLKKRNCQKKVDLGFVASERETRKLLAASNLGKSLGGKQLFKGVDITLSPGTRLGIVGKNGTGKSTLLKILSGEIDSDMGTRKEAVELKIVTFDQHRESIPENITLREALSPNGETVNFRGQQIHVSGWAQKFLFSSDRLNMPVKFLSGGERARILIARLMQQPADILLLDEPTNDLDIPTLEVMEKSLLSFEGAVVLITHDRCLMDRVCTTILGLGEGKEQDFFADYSQWESACLKPPVKKEISEKRSKAKPKLNYKEKKELEGMEAAITDVEQKIEQVHKRLEEPEVQSNFEKTQELCKEAGEYEAQLTALFERWDELEKKL